MNVLHGIVLIYLFVITKGEGFYVSNKTVTASGSIKGYECQLAVPSLEYSPDGVKVVVDPNIVTEDVWIGYYREKTAMEYFGCVKTDYFQPSYNTISDPGDCLSACGGYHLIGIYDTKCFCFEKEDNIKDTLSSHCTNSCADYGYVCGGLSTDGITYMSLYRSIGTVIATTGDKAKDKRCLSYTNQVFDWEKCATELAFICEKDGDDTWFIKEDKLNWKPATNVCFKSDYRPSTYNTSILIRHKDMLWTGVVRSYVIYKYLIESLLTGKFAYLKKENENIVLKWSDYNKTKKVLCVKEETTTEPPPTTSTKPTVKVTTTPFKPSSPPTSTEKKKTSAITDSTASTNTSSVTKLPSKTTTLDMPTTTKTSTTILSRTKTDSHTNSKLNSNNKTEPSNTGFVVGAAVSAVVVIAIVIVVVVLLLRRRGNKEKQPSHQMSIHHNNAYALSARGQNQQNTDSQEEYADIDTTTVATGDEQKSDYVQDYFILEKTPDNTFDRTKDKRVKKNDKGASNPYNNSGYEDGPYDTTEDVNQKPKPDTFNPYSHLDDNEEESSDYDHIGKGKTANVGRDATVVENTYNISNLGFLKNKTDVNLGGFEEYDHIGKVKYGNAGGKHAIDEENTYNTTDLGFLNTSAGACDNIYNLTGENDVEDTYSHINGRKRHQTEFKASENDYDTFKK